MTVYIVRENSKIGGETVTTIIGVFHKMEDAEKLEGNDMNRYTSEWHVQ